MMKFRRLLVSLGVASVLAAATPAPPIHAWQAAPPLARSSNTPAGTSGNTTSREPVISADGRFVAFASLASDLVPGDTNEREDIFVHDRQTGAVERVSVASDGAQGNGHSERPAISADGRYVAFDSTAGNLVPGDTNGDPTRTELGTDVFVHDRQTRQTTRVSVASGGAQADADALGASISADGRLVAFYTRAGNLAPGDTNRTYDVFLHDRQTGQTSMISRGLQGESGADWSINPAISADGRHVAFYTRADDLVPGDTNRGADIVVYEREGGTLSRVSVSSSGDQGEGGGFESTPAISADGRYVAFSSWASNLVPGDTNRGYDLFVHDRQTRRTTRVSYNEDGSQVDDLGVPGVAISSDGRYVIYAAGLRLAIHDRLTGKTVHKFSRVFFTPSISSDSRLIAFTSDATLLENDHNHADDVFVYQLDQAELLPSRDQRCFPETGQCMAEDFARYWEAQGGLPVFGYPIAPATGELNRDLKTLYLTQWFERNRFELHLENQPPYRVLLGRLGDERLRQLGRDWQQEPRAAGPQVGCLWFEATRHNVCNQGTGTEGPLGFLRYWRDHGLEFDGQPGASYEESLALFGLPLSEARLETNSSGDTVLTQWFERARFEWHPGNPDEYKVLLGLLGNELRAAPQ